MSNYGTMIDRIGAELERSDIDTVIGSHINDSIKLFRSKNWWFLQGPTSAALTSTTTADNSYVAEYSGLIQLDSLRVTINSQKEDLSPISFDEMEALHDGTENANQPYLYTRHGGRVRLYPTPDDVYTLTWSGLFEEAALSADGDSNDWMTHGEVLIRNHARMTVLRDYIRDYEAAMACGPAIGEAISSLNREHMRRSATRTIRPRC